MRIADLIYKKAQREELNDDEVRFFINELVTDGVEDSQLGAMLMAWFLNGMSPRELAVMTHAMTYSGETLTWPEEWKPILVDKHSTGGVGDKVSLVLAPALAACGLKVPMVSGRGLGFTGGTLDKLESIPGFTVDLTQEDMRKCLADSGCCIAGQTATLVPADRIMYATRDITSTVDNVNFVTASIISKKAATGAGALVLDIKVGRGSFTKTIEAGRFLAGKLVSAARELDVRTSAVLTRMDQPIGMAVGNSLEVIEAISTLKGVGPSDLIELVTIQGGILLESIGKAENISQGCEIILETLKSGTALSRFEKMLINQNVDPGVARELCYGDVNKILPKAKLSTPFTVTSTGRVAEIDSLTVSHVCGALGASRARASDVIQFAVGLELLVKVGQVVAEGDTWAILQHETPLTPELQARLDRAIVIDQTALVPTPLNIIIETIH